MTFAQFTSCLSRRHEKNTTILWWNDRSRACRPSSSSCELSETSTLGRSRRVCPFACPAHRRLSLTHYNLQTPLKEIVVYHPEQEYLDDIAVLKQYIYEELNVREVILSSDEQQCGVKWKVDADWPVLGKKLRKDLPRLKKALPTVTSEQAKAYLADGKITIDGIELVAGDLTTQRFVELPAPIEGSTEVDAAQYSSGSDSDVVVLLDIKVRPDFVQEAYARELTTKVQKARKAAGCQPTDEMDIYLAYADEEAREMLNNVLQSKADVISRVLKRVPQDDGQRDKSRPVYWESPEDLEQEVGGAKFRFVVLESGK